MPDHLLLRATATSNNVADLAVDRPAPKKSPPPDDEHPSPIVQPFFASEGANGTLTVWVYDVPADPAPALTVNDPALTITTTTPGQNAAPMFVGAAGQAVTVRLSSNGLGSVTVTLVRPDGTTQATTTSSAASFNMTSQTLGVAGSYTVKINPSGAATGSIGVRVTTP